MRRIPTSSCHPAGDAPRRCTRDGNGPFGDTFLYLTLAYNLDAGHGFSGADDGGAFGVPSNRPATYVPSVARGPVYPFFIRAVYQTIGGRDAMRSADTWPVNWNRVRIAQCVLHALTSVLVYAFARTIWPSACFGPS